MKRLTITAKIIIVCLIVGGAFGLYKLAESQGWVAKIAPQGKQERPIEKGTFNFSKEVATTNNKKDDDKTIRVSVVTWGGYAGGEYFNGGFKPFDDSRYLKDYGIKVEFVLIDDPVNALEAWKAGSVDVLWTTVDSFVTMVAPLKEYSPKIIFQADWSRGGDAIVSRRGIETVADLKGKKVSVAFGSPSHTFLLWLLDAGDLQYSDIQVVQAPSAVDSAAYFKAGKVDAAVVWSPDDEDCVTTVPGAKVLKSTKAATHIIADVFFAKEKFIQSHRNELKALVEGWLIGASEINTSEEAKKRAAKILAG
jgi:NitT/TauT family transport system substrate-binding protein